MQNGEVIEREKERGKQKKEIKLFLGITIIVSAVLEGLIIGTGEMYYAAFLMWTPALAAGITKFVYFRKEKNALLFRRCKIRYLLIALGLPFLYLSIPYCMYWMMNPSSMQVAWSIRMIPEMVIGILTAMVTTLGEEIGWRGFLVPRLAVWIGVKKALLLSGLIWGVWHCPLLLSGMYMPGVPVWYAVPMFLIIITSVGILIGMITLRSKSVWPAVLMHAVHNSLDQNILAAGTVGESKIYFVSETGIITALIVAVLAIGMLYMKKQRVVAVERG